jgi:hypothetical protein
MFCHVDLINHVSRVHAAFEEMDISRKAPVKPQRDPWMFRDVIQCVVEML